MIFKINLRRNFGESNFDPNRKTDAICALDIEDHLSANMRAAEESKLVMGKNKVDIQEKNA